MIVYIASDHAGFLYKEFIKDSLQKRGFVVEDLGPKELVEGDDYPDTVSSVGEVISKKYFGDTKKAFGIVVGGSGTGEAIVSNRFKFARAVVCNSQNMDIVSLGREHNDANIISIGARFVTKEVAMHAVEVFMKTSFDGERHRRRVIKIDRI